MKICLACSAGGHLNQFLELKDIYSRYKYYFVTFKREDSWYHSKKEKMFFVKDPAKNPLSLITNFFQSLKIFLKEKPDVVISNGAGAALSTCYIAKLFGKRVVFIECFSRIRHPSLFGKLVYPISDVAIVQWKPLLRYYKKAKYGGPIFGKIQADNKAKKQIFLTTGTRTEGFDRLIREVDKLVERGNIQQNVIGQIGNSTYIPKNFKWKRYMKPTEFFNSIKQSEKIITADGAGVISTCLRLGKPTVVVPRRKDLNEINISNEQLALELHKERLVITVHDINRLNEALNNVGILNKKINFSNKKMLTEIDNFLKRMVT